MLKEASVNEIKPYEIKPYERSVHYYETDQMGIVHHSNYIRWFEETRIDHMSQLGMNYSEMEEKGLLIPVLAVSCAYKQAIRYGETVQIACKIAKMGKVRFEMEYEIRGKDDNVLHATGSSEHCFVDKELKPISLKHTFPEWYEKLETEAKRQSV